MPKHKQPDTLRDAAMKKLVTVFGNSYQKCSIEGSVDKLRRIVTFIKEDIGPNVPWTLFPKFYDDLLFKFLWTSDGCEERPISHQRVMMEIIMDRRINGLWLNDWRLKPLDVNDAPRIRGLTKLDLSWGLVRFDFGAFRLQDLIEFRHPEKCTDYDLKIIGQNCLKLRFIDVSESKEITGEGLRALSECSKLHTAQIHQCPRLSHTDITDFLSAHAVIREFRAHPESGSAGFDCFSHSDVTIYPNISIFSITSPVVSNEELLTVIQKFPNLQCLGVESESLDPAIDWSLLKYLKELTTIVIEVQRGFTWDDFKPGLKLVGDNLIVLHIHCVRGRVTQRDLDFLHKFCPNIEDLDIDCEAHFDGETLVVPPFAKMKRLAFYCNSPDISDRLPNFEFTKMSRLESFSVNFFELSKEILVSMVTDHAKFPNLRSLSFFLFFGLPYEDTVYFRQYVEDKNLDLSLHFHPRPQSSN